MAEQLRMDATIGDKFTAPLTGLKRILLDISGLAGPKKASDDMNALASGATRAGQAVTTSILPSLQALGVTTLSVSGALAAVTASVKGFASGTSSLALASREVGVTVDRLRVLEALGERFNISPQQMQSGLKVLQKNLFDLRREGGEVYGWLRTFEPKLFEKLRTANPNEAISLVVAYLERIKDPVKRAMAAQKLLGDEAFSVLGSGLFGPLNKQIQEIEKTIGKMPAGAEKTALQAQLSFHRLGETMRGLRDQIGVDLAPALSDALQGLSGWVKDNGKEISKSITDAVEWFRKLDWKGISTEAMETARAFRDTAIAIKDVVSAVAGLLGVGAPEKKLQALRAERDKLSNSPDVGGADGAQRAQRLAELDRQIAHGEKAKNGSPISSNSESGGWGLGIAGMLAGGKIGGLWGAIAGLLGGRVASGVIAETRPDSEVKLRSRVQEFEAERDRLREQIAKSEAEHIPVPALRLRLQETERNLKDAEERLEKLLKKSFEEGGESAGKKITDALKALNPINADGTVGGGALIQRASYGGGGMWRGPSVGSPGARGGGLFTPRAGGRAPGDPLDGDSAPASGGGGRRRMPGIPRISSPRQSELMPSFDAPGDGTGAGPRIGFPSAIRAAATGVRGFRERFAGSTFDQKSPAIMRQLMRDFDLNPQQAAAIMGNLGHESGGLRQLQELRPTIPGSRGGWGWAQWTGSRRRAFEKFAAENGLDPKSDAANYGFLKKELSGSYKSAIDALRRGGGVREFEAIYEGSGVKAWGSRFAYARRALDAFSRDKDGNDGRSEAIASGISWPKQWTDRGSEKPAGFNLPAYAGDAGADLLRSAVRGGATGNPIATLQGGADLKISLSGFPANTRTSASADPIFKNIEVDRGRQAIYGPS